MGVAILIVIVTVTATVTVTTTVAVILVVVIMLCLRLIVFSVFLDVWCLVDFLILFEQTQIVHGTRDIVLSLRKVMVQMLGHIVLCEGWLLVFV